MKRISEELLAKVEEEVNYFQGMTEDDWNYRYAPNKWSKKQILGHLIDSAANNHQRFVRAQFEDIPDIVYEQDDWVAAQRYDKSAISIVILLWENYNKHLAHIISNIPQEMHERKCNVHKDEPVTLKWLASDYIQHMQHHLNQIML